MLKLIDNATMCSAHTIDLKGNVPNVKRERLADGDEDGQINYEECIKMMFAR